jgi:hypothetical protein
MHGQNAVGYYTTSFICPLLALPPRLPKPHTVRLCEAGLGWPSRKLWWTTLVQKKQESWEKELNWQSPRTLRRLMLVLVLLVIFVLYLNEYYPITNPLVRLSIVLPGMVMVLIALCLMVWGHYKYGRRWFGQDNSHARPSKPWNLTLVDRGFDTMDAHTEQYFRQILQRLDEIESRLIRIENNL